MAQHSAHMVQPGKFTVSQKVRGLIFVSIFIGVVSFVLAFQADKTTHKTMVWEGYLTSLFFFVSVTVGGLFFTAIQHATNAGWSTTVRRVVESLTAFLPYAFVATLIFVVFGSHSLFEWLDPEVVSKDEVLQNKQAYLNHSFYVIRTVAFFLLWLFFGKLIVGKSLQQDHAPDDTLTKRMVAPSVIFLVVFALSYSLFCVDHLMSLHPHWYSTIFGVYCFSGLFQSTLAFTILITIWLMKKGLLNGLVNENHLHDLGKFLFAFTVFYAYIAFSQFMLIWYANLPEETIYYAMRAHDGWMMVSMSLLVFKFIVPFLLLLPRAAKRDPDHMIRISILILVMQYVDIYWMVYPNFHQDGVVVPFWGIGIFIGFLGVFLAVVTRFLEKNSIVAVNDPRLHEALHHHI